MTVCPSFLLSSLCGRVNKLAMWWEERSKGEGQEGRKRRWMSEEERKLNFSWPRKREREKDRRGGGMLTHDSIQGIINLASWAGLGHKGRHAIPFLWWLQNFLFFFFFQKTEQLLIYNRSNQSAVFEMAIIGRDEKGVSNLQSVHLILTTLKGERERDYSYRWLGWLVLFGRRSSPLSLFLSLSLPSVCVYFSYLSSSDFLSCVFLIFSFSLLLSCLLCLSEMILNFPSLLSLSLPPEGSSLTWRSVFVCFHLTFAFSLHLFF